MKTMKISDFKAKCLKEIENLPDDGITLTKHGIAVAQVVPIRKKRMIDYYGCMKGQIQIHGDIFSTGIKWNAES